MKIKPEDYSLISNKWIDDKITGLQERIENLKKEEQTDENVYLLRLSKVKLHALEYIKRNVLIPSEELTKDLYSEEEVIKIVEKSRETGLTAEYLLLTEQFKKKQ
jgi:adenine C2-methylase RlmN of 23S rRNA A2503 and tRNA A37